MRVSHDVSVYNEATGFSVHPRGMGGFTRAELDEDLDRFVREGLLIPIELVQDDSILVRVVLGDLTPAEEEEWVGRVEWMLKIPCGSLAVEGGLDPSTQDDDDYVRFVEVPPGDYRVEVLTYLHGINGDYCIDEVNDEPLGAWFRRTRPDEEMPIWLKMTLADEPDEDPGFEDTWDEYEDYLGNLPREEYDRLHEENVLVDFVVRLTPLEGDMGEPELGEEGWFAIDTGARKPERFPLGIPYEGPLDDEDE